MKAWFGLLVELQREELHHTCADDTSHAAARWP